MVFTKYIFCYLFKFALLGTPKSWEYLANKVKEELANKAK